MTAKPKPSLSLGGRVRRFFSRLVHHKRSPRLLSIILIIACISAGVSTYMVFSRAGMLGVESS
ncbi:MAG: hypothetical protein ACK5VW_06045, partial [Holosporales bacterium]